jgi:hypothetical protein
MSNSCDQLLLSRCQQRATNMRCLLRASHSSWMPIAETSGHRGIVAVCNQSGANYPQAAQGKSWSRKPSLLSFFRTVIHQATQRLCILSLLFLCNKGFAHSVVREAVATMIVLEIRWKHYVYQRVRRHERSIPSFPTLGRTHVCRLACVTPPKPGATIRL